MKKLIEFFKTSFGQKVALILISGFVLFAVISVAKQVPGYHKKISRF